MRWVYWASIAANHPGRERLNAAVNIYYLTHSFWWSGIWERFSQMLFTVSHLSSGCSLIGRFDRGQGTRFQVASLTWLASGSWLWAGSLSSLPCRPFCTGLLEYPHDRTAGFPTTEAEAETSYTPGSEVTLHHFSNVLLVVWVSLPHLQWGLCKSSNVRG